MKNEWLKVSAVSLLALSPMFAQKSTLSQDLQKMDPRADVDVIIQFQRFADDSLHKKIKDHGGLRRANLDLVKGGLYTIPAHALNALSHDPDIVYIAPDRTEQGFLSYAAPTVNAPAAWKAGFTGTGIGVAVIDSGITATGDLDGRVVYNESFVAGTTDTSDKFGHGTHVAGIIASSGANSSGVYKGIAPNANIVNLRVLDSNGAGRDSAVISAIQRAIQLKAQYNIRVINLSLGRPVFESYTLDPVCRAVEQAWNAGIVVVVAAGNQGRNNSAGTNGYATIASPANDPSVITVGAMKTMNTPGRGDDLIASYSSKGPTLLDHVVKPDLVAPGNFTASTISKSAALFGVSPANEVFKSTYSNSHNTTNVSSTYYKLSGSSMAAPVVSGAAAILLQREPYLTPAQVKARLMKTASKTFPSTSTATDPVTGISYTSQYDIFTIGAGYLDIAAALANSDVAAGTALSPTVSFDSVSGNTYLVLDPSSVWGSSAVWGSTAVWGTSAIWGTSTVWGLSAVWGSSSAAGFSAVWGNSAVWGSGSTSSSALSTALNGEN